LTATSVCPSSGPSNPFAAFQINSQLEKLTANQFIIMKNAGFTASGKGNKPVGSTSDERSRQQKSSIDYQQINASREKVRQWILEQARKFRATYFPSEAAVEGEGGSGSGLNVLGRLKKVVGSLDLSGLVQLESDLADASLLDKSRVLAVLDGINRTHLDSLSEISKRLMGDVENLVIWKFIFHLRFDWSEC
jgi:hypothetical protein